MKQNYVLGFLFKHDLSEVVLIKKNRPDWQKGFLNGVGGKINDGESSSAAMTREFFEETGCILYDWEFVGEMSGTDWNVHVFKRATLTLHGVNAATDEEIVIVKLDEIHSRRSELVSNIPWLIYSCLDSGFKHFKFEY